MILTKRLEIATAETLCVYQPNYHAGTKRKSYNNDSCYLKCFFHRSNKLEQEERRTGGGKGCLICTKWLLLSSNSGYHPHISSAMGSDITLLTEHTDTTLSQLFPISQSGTI